MTRKILSHRGPRGPTGSPVAECALALEAPTEAEDQKMSRALPTTLSVLSNPQLRLSMESDR